MGAAAATGLAAKAVSRNEAPYGGRLLHLTDSFGAQQSGTTGAPELYKAPAGGAVWAEQLSLGRLTFDIANNKGVNGETSAQILARLNSDALSRKSAWDVCLIDAGRNDAAASKADGDATIGNIQLMASLVRKEGKLPCVMLPNPPRSFAPDGAANRSVRGYVNQQLRQWCAANNIPFVDYWRDCADPTSSGGGAWATGMSADTLHPNSAGSRPIGLRVIDALSPYVAGLSFSQAAWDGYDATLSPKGNVIGLTGANVPLVLPGGGNGTLSGTSLTGTIPQNTFMNLYSGTGACACTITSPSAAAGYGAVGSGKVNFAVSSVTAAAGWEWYGGFTIPAALAGQQVVVEMTAEIASMSSAGAFTYGAYGRGGTGGSNGEFLNGVFLANEKLLIRTAPSTVGNNGAFFQWAFGLFAAVGASGTVSVSNPVIRPQ